MYTYVSLPEGKCGTQNLCTTSEWYPNGSRTANLSTGDYTNVEHLSCATTFDQLFDWHAGGGSPKLTVSHDMS